MIGICPKHRLQCLEILEFFVPKTLHPPPVPPYPFTGLASGLLLRTVPAVDRPVAAAWKKGPAERTALPMRRGCRQCSTQFLIRRKYG